MSIVGRMVERILEDPAEYAGKPVSAKEPYKISPEEKQELYKDAPEYGEDAQNTDELDDLVWKIRSLLGELQDYDQRVFGKQVHRDVANRIGDSIDGISDGRFIPDSMLTKRT